MNDINKKTYQLYITANESLKLIKKISDSITEIKINEPILEGSTENGEKIEIRITPASLDNLPWSLKKTNIELKKRSTKNKNIKK